MWVGSYLPAFDNPTWVTGYFSEAGLTVGSFQHKFWTGHKFMLAELQQDILTTLLPCPIELMHKFPFQASIHSQICWPKQEAVNAEDPMLPTHVETFISALGISSQHIGALQGWSKLKEESGEVPFWHVSFKTSVPYITLSTVHYGHSASS